MTSSIPSHRVTQNPTDTFSYDGVGNRLTSTDHSDWGYNNRNQLVGYNGIAFIYDSNGNTIAKMDTSGTTGYTYNYENRLKRIDFPGGGYAEYKYDVRGRRIEKNVNGTITKYLYDGSSLIAEYDASDTLIRNYFYGAGDINPSLLYEGSSVYFYHHDHLNTPQKITDESGNIVWEAVYESFGEVNITTETVSNNLRFSGQYYDQESGLHYNYHRYYDSSTGRYFNEDKINLKTLQLNDHTLKINDKIKAAIENIVGIELSDTEIKEILIYYLSVFPSSLNPYIYVYNNPIIYYDDGNLVSPVVAAVVIGAGLAIWAINWYYWNVWNPPDLCDDSLSDEKPNVPKGPGLPRNFPPYHPSPGK